MTHYRLYQLVNDRIAASSDFEAASDEEALAHAESQIQGDAVEVWSGRRKIGVRERTGPISR